MDAARNRRDERGLSPAIHALYAGERAKAERILPDAPTVFEAAAFGLEPRLRVLLDAEPWTATAFSGDGFTALHLAAFMGHPGAVKLLLERGADPEAVATSQEIGPVQPLHSAAATGRVECAQLLLAAGADVNARQAGGFTPLHSAAQSGNEELTQVLLDAGADPAAKTDDGKTAADLAP
ncbi:MAG: ankyrin repeat domain-containing protein [Gaiellaceae bacterium]